MECYNYYTHGEVAPGDILHEFFLGLLNFNIFSLCLAASGGGFSKAVFRDGFFSKVYNLLRRGLL